MSQKKKTKKVKLLELLVEKEIFSDRKKAKSWILSGKVIVNDQRIDKAGQMVPKNANIRIKGVNRYVGKGGFKLEGALSDLNVNVIGKTVLDAGASTGGFTDCLLQHGAKRVYAIDAGYGSLAGKLRIDKRVVVFERTNISDISPHRLKPLPSLATLDLSYISLRKAIPVVSKLLEPDGEMICLVKPLFEIQDAAIRRSGIIDKPDDYEKILFDLIVYIEHLGLKFMDVTRSQLPGEKGTREFFIRISKDLIKNARQFDIKCIVGSA